MGPFQYWLEHTLFNLVAPVTSFMHTQWGWPFIESVHFIGLTLLFGSIATWDLRLLGVAKHVPIAAFHRLVPFAVLGFAINLTSGLMFLMTEPNQYIYNQAFHFKMMFLGLAGLNVLVFYLTIFRRVSAPDAGAAALHVARLSGAVSLALWTGVIICGRLLTFYRPIDCEPGQAIGFIADCVLR